MPVNAMMEACATHCRWCPVIPIVIGLALFLLGFFLEAETIHILWFALTIVPVIMGSVALIFINTIAHNMHKSS